MEAVLLVKRTSEVRIAREASQETRVENHQELDKAREKTSFSIHLLQTVSRDRNPSPTTFKLKVNIYITQVCAPRY